MNLIRRISGPLGRPTVITGAATLAVLLALAGCGQATTTSTTPTTSSQNLNERGTKNFADEPGGEVELGDNFFSPTVIQGKAGQTLRLELKNEGSAEHNFTLTEQSVDRDVGAGEDAKVSVEVPRSGRVGFFCKYHIAQGMGGSLAVSSAAGDDSGSGSSGGTTTESNDSSGGGGYGY